MTSTLCSDHCKRDSVSDRRLRLYFLNRALAIIFIYRFLTVPFNLWLCLSFVPTTPFPLPLNGLLHACHRLLPSQTSPRGLTKGPGVPPSLPMGFFLTTVWCRPHNPSIRSLNRIHAQRPRPTTSPGHFPPRSSSTGVSDLKSRRFGLKIGRTGYTA